MKSPKGVKMAPEFKKKKKKKIQRVTIMLFKMPLNNAETKPNK